VPEALEPRSRLTAWGLFFMVQGVGLYLFWAPLSEELLQNEVFRRALVCVLPGSLPALALMNRFGGILGSGPYGVMLLTVAFDCVLFWWLLVLVGWVRRTIAMKGNDANTFD
jgi:hypothetical protein